MDKTKPPNFSAFTRADMALRRMPGLGMILFLLLADMEYRLGNWLDLAFVAIAAATVLFIEFAPKPKV